MKNRIFFGIVLLSLITLTVETSSAHSFASKASGSEMLEEGFEGALFPPAEWSESSSNWECQWQQTTEANSGLKAAQAGCYDNLMCTADLISPVIDLTNCTQADLSFFWKVRMGVTISFLQVSASSDGVTWNNLSRIWSTGWVSETDYADYGLSLVDYVGGMVHLKWHFYMAAGYPPYNYSFFNIDDVTISCTDDDDDNIADDDTSDDDSSDDDFVDDDIIDDDHAGDDSDDHAADDDTTAAGGGGDDDNGGGCG